MGFNSAFKGLTLILLTWTIWRIPTNASKWQMGFNSAFKGLNVDDDNEDGNKNNIKIILITVK